MIRGKMSILSSLIRMSPGNPIANIALSDGSAIRSINPRMMPSNTDTIVKNNSKLSLNHFLVFSLPDRVSCTGKVYSCLPDSTSILKTLDVAPRLQNDGYIDVSPVLLFQDIPNGYQDLERQKQIRND